jgi:hypothetical protein
MRSNVHGIIRLAALIVIIAALAAGTAFAQPSADEPERIARGGIKVSGYWSIDILNPDGSQASHTEFENALRLEGGTVMAILLSGTMAVQTPFINLDGPTHLCGTTGGWGCLIVPNRPVFVGTPSASGVFTGQTFFPTLVTSAQTSPSPKLVLTGLATIPSGGTIGNVQTGVAAGCPPAGSCFLTGLPISPFGPPGVKLPFTEFTLPTPINVQNGQVVSVTVTLSFSS